MATGAAALGIAASAALGVTTGSALADPSGRSATLLQATVVGVSLLLTALAVALLASRWIAVDRATQLQASEKRLESSVVELRRAAYTDALTGLPNRARLNEVLTQVTEARRGDAMVAVILLDLDDFKEINDTLGHQAGDEAIIGLARRLQTATRAEDLVARLGGDEFVVVCELPDDMMELHHVMGRILGEVSAKPLWIAGRPVAVRASAGVALAGRWYLAEGELLRQADTALYVAKGAGKNSWSLFDHSMQEDVRARFELSQDLSLAIERDQLSLAFQPIVDLTSGRIVEVEALLRWEDARWGAVSPIQVVEAAESSGQAGKLGEWVIRAACAQAAAFHRRGAPDGFVVAINLAGSQLTDLSLVSTVEAILVETGCSASWIAIEITETCLIADPEKAVSVLERLRTLGIHLSLDDFGTGYSSLSHLLRLPVETVKIDRSILLEQASGTRTRHFLASICEVARSLGLRVLIEGVETQEHLDIVRTTGFQLAQGFLTGRPQAPERIADILADERRVPVGRF